MKIKKLNEDIQHCWFGYYVSPMTREKKYIYVTKDVAGRDADYAAEYMEDGIPEPYTKFVFQGSIDNTQAEKQGMKLVESVDNNKISAVVSKYNDAFYDASEGVIDCGSEKTCRAIARELSIGPANTSNSAAGHKIYLKESKLIKTFGAKAKKLNEDSDYFPSEDDYDRIDRSGTNDERLVAAVSYMYGVDTNTAKEYIPDLGDTQRKKALAYYDLRGLPHNVRLAKIKELYPRVRESIDCNKGDWVEVNLNTRKNGTPNIIPVKVDSVNGPMFRGRAWGERQHEYPKGAIVKKIDMDDVDAIIKKYTPSGYMTENVRGMGQYSDKFYDYLDYLEANGDEGNLSYLASQLIRYCKEEDLKDLWVDRMGKIAEDNGFGANSGELTEDVETPVLSAPAEGPESGLAALLNTAMQDELKTIQMYNDIAVTASAEGFEDIVAQVNEINTEENKHVGQLQELLKTVAPNAQAIDAGELEAGDDLVVVNESVDNDLIQQLVTEYKELWTPDSSDTIFDEICDLHGKDVASVAIEELMKEYKSWFDECLNNSNSAPNNNSNDKGAAIMEGKERWEEIYNSFKTIEQELNGDGEAITATVDKLYKDNVDDPDYKKAYDKWASGE